MVGWIGLNGSFRLLRGFGHASKPASGQPAVEELLQPGALGEIMHRAIGEMMMPRRRARHLEAGVAARGPAMHHRVGHVGMKLEAEAMAGPKRLDREVAAFGQQFGACGQVKSFAVPVIDMIRPVWHNASPAAVGRIG